MIITASQKITLICGSSYIRISQSDIELGTASNVYIKSNALQKMGAKTIAPNPLALPYIIGDYAVKFICKDEDENEKIKAITTLPNVISYLPRN